MLGLPQNSSVFPRGAGYHTRDDGPFNEGLPEDDTGQDEELRSALEQWHLADAPPTDDWLEDLPGPWSAREVPESITTAGHTATEEEDTSMQTDSQAGKLWSALSTSAKPAGHPQ